MSMTTTIQKYQQLIININTMHNELLTWNHLMHKIKKAG